jgi:hypothetical protein
MWPESEMMGGKKVLQINTKLSWRFSKKAQRQLAKQHIAE